MNPQSGSILMIMLLVLIMGGSLFLYAALNQSSQQMKFDQTQNQLQQLNEIKQRLILFAREPSLFCTNEIEPGYLPETIDSDRFGFDSLTNHELISYTLKESTASAICRTRSNQDKDIEIEYSVINACTTPTTLVATLSWPGLTDPPPSVRIFKNELGC